MACSLSRVRAQARATHAAARHAWHLWYKICIHSSCPTSQLTTSLVDDIIDMVVLGMNRARQEFLQLVVPADSLYAELAAWSAFMIVVATASVKWTAVFDPMAMGSGIPEMKSIISYDKRDEASRYLRARTLVSKIGGLALALSNGVSLGKEGPFVHTSSIIAHRLMKNVRYFHRVFDNDFMRRHVYDAACAVGVATTFQAPIGGALFAIDVTCTVFMVSNYWRSFAACISSLIAREAVSMVQPDWFAAYHAMYATNFEPESFRLAEIVAFVVLAVLTGLLGALYVSTATAFRLRWKAWAASKSAVLTSLILLFPLAVVLCLPVGMTRLTFQDIIDDLTVATAVSFSLPVPTGDFIPTFIAGTTIGRFCGEVLRLAFPTAGIVPGGYALAGGAGFVASTTNTTSVAIIALEFTGQFIYTVPLILSTLIASSVGVIAKKGFIHLRILDLQDLTAHDIMLRRFPVLTLDMAKVQLESILKVAPTPTLPLVENLDNMLFVGCAPRSTVEQFIRDVEVGQSTQLRSALQLPQEEDEAVPTAIQVSVNTAANLVLPTEITGQREAASAVVESNPVPAVHGDINPLAANHLTTEETVNSAAHQRQLVDSTALQVDPGTSLQTIHLLFEVVKCSSICVTRRGRLVGLTTPAEPACSHR